MPVINWERSTWNPERDWDGERWDSQKKACFRATHGRLGLVPDFALDDGPDADGPVFFAYSGQEKIK